MKISFNYADIYTHPYSMLMIPSFFLKTAFAIYQSLPYFESFGTYSTKLPFDLSIYFPYVLKLYLLILFIGKWFFSFVFVAIYLNRMGKPDMQN